MKRILLIAVLTVGNYLIGQVTNGLVAEYTFNNGSANDEVGSNDGTVYGVTTSTDRFGNANKAYYFDGITNYIDLGINSEIKPSIGTISLWFNMDDLSFTGSGYGYNPLIVCKNDQAGDSYFEGYGMYYSTSNNKVAVITTESQTANEKYMFSENTFDLDTWHHLVMAFDNDSLWFYTNGTLEGEIYKGFMSTFSSSLPVLLGNSGNLANNRFFNGGMDDIRIYNRVLTAEEVVILFNEENPLTASLKENSKVTSDLNVYPNPSTSTITIQVNNPTNVSIMNSIGQEIENRTITSTQTIDISRLETGIYFVKDIQTGYIKKFIKQ